MNTKPGIKTSEFWLTVVSLLIGAGIALGLFTNEEGKALEGAAAQLVTAVFGFVAVAGPVIAYIYSRTKVKTAVSSSIEKAAIEPA